MNKPSIPQARFLDLVAKLKQKMEHPTHLKPRHSGNPKALVRFRCIHNRKGTTDSIDARPKAYPIVARYLHGAVKVSTGDTYEVTAFNGEGVSYLAVR